MQSFQSRSVARRARGRMQRPFGNGRFWIVSSTQNPLICGYKLHRCFIWKTGFINTNALVFCFKQVGWLE